MEYFAKIHDNLKSVVGDQPNFNPMILSRDTSTHSYSTAATAKFTGEGFISFGLPWSVENCKNPEDAVTRNATSKTFYDLTFMVDDPVSITPTPTSYGITNNNTASPSTTETSSNNTPWMLATFALGGLIIGTGLGIGIMLFIKRKNNTPSQI